MIESNEKGYAMNTEMPDEMEGAPIAWQQLGSPSIQHHAQSTTISMGAGQASVSLDSNGPDVAALSQNLASLEKTQRQFPEELVPWENVVDIKVLAEEMVDLIKSHSVLPDSSADAMVLWTIASYLINRFRVFPKLAFISPTKRCGKTTTMEMVQALVRDGVMASNMSQASLYRISDNGVQPTLIIDEADTTVKHGSPELVGIINSSHSKSGAHVVKCTGDDNKVRAFSTWMPMVLASIGDLPSTIMDRSIVIQLLRKKQSEPVARLPGDLLEKCQPVRRQLLRWCAESYDAIDHGTAEPAMIGNDRAVDNWLPLFRVAEQMGGNWLKRCDVAYDALTVVEEEDLPTQLLTDIRSLFLETKVSKIRTSALIQRLRADSERPWASDVNGKPLNERTLANMLKAFGIRPHGMRVEGKSVRGYERTDFNDAFGRYLES